MIELTTQKETKKNRDIIMAEISNKEQFMEKPNQKKVIQSPIVGDNHSVDVDDFLLHPDIVDVLCSPTLDALSSPVLSFSPVLLPSPKVEQDNKNNDRGEDNVPLGEGNRGEWSDFQSLEDDGISSKYESNLEYKYAKSNLKSGVRGSAKLPNLSLFGRKFSASKEERITVGTIFENGSKKSRFLSKTGEFARRVSQQSQDAAAEVKSRVQQVQQARREGNMFPDNLVPPTSFLVIFTYLVLGTAYSVIFCAIVGKCTTN